VGGVETVVSVRVTNHHRNCRRAAASTGNLYSTRLSSRVSSEETSPVRRNHRSASLLINQGLHPKIVQEHLGHQSISITFDRYGHLYETDNQRLADALDAAYSTGLVASEAPRVIRDADASRTDTPTGVTGEQSQPARSQSLQGV
jgi:hypothetical protein